jgi:hypothetical protein
MRNDEDNDYELGAGDMDAEEEDRTNETESAASPSLMDRIKKVYNNIFFYGIDVPKRNKKKQINYDIPKKVGFDSLFFTRSELIALYGLDRDRPSKPGKRNTKSSSMRREGDELELGASTEALQTRIDRVSKTLTDLQDDVELIDAMLLTCPEDDDEAKKIFSSDNSSEEAVTRSGLLSRRKKLLETIAALKIEYVNLIAESSS